MADPDFIKVADMALEMGMTEREVWELMRRWGVPCTHPANMGRARLRRSDFIAARDSGMKPPPPPARKARPVADAVEQAPARQEKPARPVGSKVKAFRAGRA